jgi:hypothetical protein
MFLGDRSKSSGTGHAGQRVRLPSGSGFNE